jgi:hypothetical protein
VPEFVAGQPRRGAAWSITGSGIVGKRRGTKRAESEIVGQGMLFMLQPIGVDRCSGIANDLQYEVEIENWVSAKARRVPRPVHLGEAGI